MARHEETVVADVITVAKRLPGPHNGYKGAMCEVVAVERGSSVRRFMVELPVDMMDSVRRGQTLTMKIKITDEIDRPPAPKSRGRRRRAADGG